MATGYFEPSKGETPESIRRKRDMIRALMGAQRAPQNVGEGLNALGDGIVAAILDTQADKAEGAGRDSANAAFNAAVGGGGYFPPAPGGQGSTTAPTSASIFPSRPTAEDFAAGGPAVVASRSAGSGVLPPAFAAAVDRSEGGGGYDTLFGFSNRKGPFAGVDVSKMSIRDAMAFADPSGPYGQFVKSKVGRVATPMGRHQIVGTTLGNAVREMGLDPNATFDPDMQDRIALHLASNRVGSAGTLDGKIAALRSEWEGFKSVPNAQMAQIVAEIEGLPAGSGARAPVQVASLDPAAGVYEATAEQGLPADSPGVQALAALAAREGTEAAPLAQPTGGTVPPPTRIAQALTGGTPEMAGNGGPVDPKGATIRQLMGAMGNQWLSENQQRILGALLEQEMKKADPAYKIELEKAQLELAALKNPQMSPAEKANYELNLKKFGAEEAQRIFEREQAGKEFGLKEKTFASEDADRTADNARADQELAIKQLEYMLKTEPDFYAKYVAQEEAAGRQPLGILDYAKQLKKAGADNLTIGGTTVEGEKEYDKTVGGGFGKRFLETQDAETAARDTLTSLDIMERAMSDPNFYSGWGAEQLAGVRRFGTAIGITDPESVKDMETFAAQARKAALDSMGGSLGTGFSNADRVFVTGQVPGLENTPAGNKQLIGIMRKINGRKLEIAQMARDYAKGNNGRIDTGFNDKLAEYAKANPLFPQQPAATPPVANKPVTDMTDAELEAIINGR